MNDLVLRWLVSTLTLAFLAWAGVVWHGTEKIMERLNTIQGTINEYKLETNRRLTEHEKDIQVLQREAEKRSKW